ncbi:MAG: translation initiation factor IF-2, partial [Malacoplasma sp.]|nr:translation initiation factor IF-2 [Malacoplasma sp.]MDE6429122.1 translation initiation factor IF-2 [Malacoplasma sp.]MDE7112492.1 translation initiation factor IF-2 [Malacoplasma sp.]
VDNRSNIDIKSQFKKVEIGIKNGVFVFTNNLTIDEFSKKINKSSSEIIKHLFLNGVTCNLNTLLDERQIGELCLEFGYDFKKELQINEDNFLDNIKFEDKAEHLVKRPPIVTIMGHVDHGKTTLLDTIRKTNIAEKEAGKITQSIGAYQVEWKKNLITFIDTPGHEAFSKMRAVGADLTDIVVLVVAADDGLKPQTEEAIDHALYAKVPIIVFINKMDKPTINIDKILTQLSDKDVVCEEWGGKTMVVKGSAINGTGINELLEAIILTAEIMELKANKDRLANGIAIEASMDKGEGAVADLLVQSGTLAVNDYILVGEFYGKVKKMVDYNKKEIKFATPSTPVRISGLNGIPKSGDKWIVTKDEKLLKELSAKRQQNTKKKLLNFTSNLSESNIDNKELNIILKTDNNGSLEAIKSLLKSLDIPGTKLNVIRGAIGHIKESDIDLARTSKSLIISFNLKTSLKVSDYATSMGIKIKNYNIIYQIKDEIEKLLKGILDPVYVEKELGTVEVRQIWQHSSIGKIAGCRVLTGEIKRNALARIKRKNAEIISGAKINSLKHGKESINNALAGKECGFTLENFNDFIEGDIVEIYEIVEENNE